MTYLNKNFYQKQSIWSPKNYFGSVNIENDKKVSIIKKYIPRKGNILDLGAGGGQNALAMANLGYDTMALELLSNLVKEAKRNAAISNGRLSVIQGDFYKIKLNKKFQLITYWDGFGIGDDNDQRKLLKRINDWLTLGGMAIIEVYAPWYPGYFLEKEMEFDNIRRKFGFDYENCRWEDTWWQKGSKKKIRQSLRCYSPADLKLLIEPTGLVVKDIIPCLGYKKGESLLYGKNNSLNEAITYLAVLKKSRR